LLLAFLSFESRACRIIKLDVDAELKTAKNAAIGVITSASSADSETIIGNEFERQSFTADSDEDSFLIGCGICHSSYQTIHITVSSQRTIKGEPSRLYNLNFKACIDKSDYSLFSKVVIFDNGNDIRDVSWQLLDEENLKVVNAYAENDS
jgi:hypothetical protein